MVDSDGIEEYPCDVCEEEPAFTYSHTLEAAVCRTCAAKARKG